MSKDTYRQAASVVLLRPSSVCAPEGCGTLHQVLILHKPRKKDDWQLPQGGVEEGETLEQAALRELQEEAGVTNVRILGRSADVYQYDFPPSFRRFRPDNVCGQCIGYVYALAPENAPVRVDQKEIDGHVWVLPEELHLYIRRKEYLTFVQRLVAEAVRLAGASGGTSVL